MQHKGSKRLLGTLDCAFDGRQKKPPGFLQTWRQLLSGVAAFGRRQWKLYRVDAHRHHRDRAIIQHMRKFDGSHPDTHLLQWLVAVVETGIIGDPLFVKIGRRMVVRVRAEDLVWQPEFKEK